MNSYNHVRNKTIKILDKQQKHKYIKDNNLEEYSHMRKQFNPSKSPPNNSFLNKIDLRLKLYYDKSYN